MSANIVFGCDELRKEILSYIPVRCESCHNKMDIKTKFKHKYYWKEEYRRSRNVINKKYCNWCWHYVFEYD